MRQRTRVESWEVLTAFDGTQEAEKLKPEPVPDVAGRFGSDQAMKAARAALKAAGWTVRHANFDKDGVIRAYVIPAEVAKPRSAKSRRGASAKPRRAVPTRSRRRP